MIKKFLTGVVLVLGSIVANAAPIVGQLDYTGFASVERAGGAYTAVEIINSFVVNATGVYADEGVGSGTSITLTDLSLPALLPATIWKTGIFEFSLESITQNDGTTLAGVGTVSAAGYDDTHGSWSFTSQGNDTGNFAFSSTTVPAPASIALMGLGLIGLGMTRRKAK